MGVRAWSVLGFLLLVPLFAGLWLHFHTTRYDHMIRLAAARHQLDFRLIKAVVCEESWFRADIRGSAGEYGLMQVSRAAAMDYQRRKSFLPFHEDRLHEPEFNIEVGSWYLRQSLNRYRESPDPTLFAILRYNAGEVRADQWLKLALNNPVPAGILPERHYLSLVDFPKTQEYARRVLDRARSGRFWF